jgi:hypothetical protein
VKLGVAVGLAVALPVELGEGLWEGVLLRLGVSVAEKGGEADGLRLGVAEGVMVRLGLWVGLPVKLAVALLDSVAEGDALNEGVRLELKVWVKDALGVEDAVEVSETVGLWKGLFVGLGLAEAGLVICAGVGL